MKQMLFFIALLALGLACNPSASEQKETQKAIGAHNRAVYIKDGWIRDPYIYLASDGYYYLTGTTPIPNDPREKEDKYNLGLTSPALQIGLKPSLAGYKLRVWRSPDLSEWEYLGEPFSLEQGYWMQKNPDTFRHVAQKEWFLWAPEIYYTDSAWICVHTSPSPEQGGANLIVKRDGLMGNSFDFPLGDSMRFKHDPSLFEDDDGTWYLLWGNTMIVPLKPGFAGLAGEPMRIEPSNRRIGHEGATIRKIGRKYVHFGTAWSTDKGRQGSYNLYYCTSDSITGPYGERKFAGRFLGHGTPFKDKEGRWWCTAFFNGNVPPIDDTDIRNRNLSKTAQTINEQGTTIVPLEVRILEDGDVYIRAKDERYAYPGPDEAQQF